MAVERAARSARQDVGHAARSLDETGALLRLGGGEKFRLRAYEHAARIVRTLGRELGRQVEQGELPRLSV